METIFDFSEALKIVKNGGKVTRQAWSRAGDVKITIEAQFPDENSKMTKPYLYMVKQWKNEEGNVGGTDMFPLDLSAESIFADDWYRVK